jgi:oligopeptide transport system substrate-binding protein
MRRLASGIGAALAVALVLSGCGGAQKASGKAKALRIALAAEPIKWLNPLNGNSSADIQVAGAMFAPLVETDPGTGKLRNVVAESVTPDATSQTWTIKIKSDWTFQNGQKLTARDYVDSWNLTAYGPNAWANNGFFAKFEGYDALNPEVPEGQKAPEPAIKEMSGLKVVDDTTFTVKLKYPFSQFGLTLQYLGLTPLAEEVRKDPKAYERKQIGMGPYKLAGEWKVGEDIKLVKWDGFKGTAPDADTVTFTFIPNADTAYNEFLAGTIDVVSVPSTKKKSFKEDAPDRWLVSESAGNIAYWAFPSWEKAYADPRLRHAFSMAIDRQAFADLVGLAKPATSLVPPGIDGQRPDACKYCNYDPAAAKKLFDAAGGLPGGLTIYYNTATPTGQIFSEALGNMMRRTLGVQVKYVGKQGSEISDLADEKKIIGMRLAGWGHDYPSIEDYLTPMFKSSGDANFAKYASPKLDDLLARGDAQSDPAAAIKLYQQAEDIALEDMPLIPLYHVQDAYLHAKGVNPRNSKYVGVWPLWSTIDR